MAYAMQRKNKAEKFPPLTGYQQDSMQATNITLANQQSCTDDFNSKHNIEICKKRNKESKLNVAKKAPN